MLAVVQQIMCIQICGELRTYYFFKQFAQTYAQANGAVRRGVISIASAFKQWRDYDVFPQREENSFIQRMLKDNVPGLYDILINFLIYFLYSYMHHLFIGHSLLGLFDYLF